MRRQKQIQFEGSEFIKPNSSFGGSLLKNSHAKRSRPLDSKLPIHLSLRAHKSLMRLPKTIRLVDSQVEWICKKHGVTLYKYANVGNHLHLVIKIPQRRRWNAFIRELSGRIAQLVREKLKLEGEFWTQRPFTRLVKGWQKAFQVAKDYVYLNWCEGEGHINRKQTKTLRDLRKLLDLGVAQDPG
jgi:REP element-mobilizing transposase RayT